MTERYVYDWNVLDAPRPTGHANGASPPANGHVVVTGYSNIALAREADTVRNAPEGMRNPTLNVAAFNLGQLVGGGSLDRGDVERTLTVAAQAAGLLDTEIRKTIRSGLDAGVLLPRSPAPLPNGDGAGLAGLVAPGHLAAPAPVAGPGRPLGALATPAPAPGAPSPATAPTAATDAGPTTWAPLGIQHRLDSDAAAPEPTHLWRDDDVRLFYSGKINGLLGESESGKTWVALKAIADALLGGERVLMLDFEDNANTIVERLTCMSVDPDAIALLDYASPTETLGAVQSEQLAAALREHRYMLIVLDGVNAAMTLLGYDLNSNTDATLFLAKLLRPLALTGACVITVDHVPKSVDNRGKGGIGAQAKRAMMDGCALMVSVVEPFGRGQNGVLKLHVDKDRPGKVRGATGQGGNAGRALFTSREDGTVRITIAAPDTRPDAERGPFRPTGLMEKVSRFLEAAAQPVSSNTVVDGAASKRANVLKALALLTAEGHVKFTQGPNRSHLYSPLRPYRQHEDRSSDTYIAPVVPVGPGGSPVVPGNHGGSGGSLVPTPYRGEPDRNHPPDTSSCNACGEWFPDAEIDHGEGYCRQCAVGR